MQSVKLLQNIVSNRIITPHPLPDFTGQLNLDDHILLSIKLISPWSFSLPISDVAGGGNGASDLK
jgi:hypothetical protein